MYWPISSSCQCEMSLPSILALPVVGASKPTSTLARVVLPDPDGPTIPRTSPGTRVKLMSLNRKRFSAGMAKARLLASTIPSGLGRVTGRCTGLMLCNCLMTRCIASRLPTNARQAPINCSMGASARVKMIDAAIMPPGVSSSRITSSAPRPMIMTCRLRRTNFPDATAEASFPLTCWVCCNMESFALCHILVIRPSAPMLTSASAL